MNTKLIITAVLAGALGVAAGWYAPHQSASINSSVPALASTVVSAPVNADPSTSRQVLYYTCPMHPTIHYDHPGDCPICGMKLQPVYADGTNAPALPACCGGATCQ